MNKREQAERDEAKRDEVKRELRSAIERYRQFAQNEHGHKVLSRLMPRVGPGDEDDPSALVLPAFESAPEHQWPTLFYACVRGVQAQREHPNIIERSRLRDREKAGDAANALDIVERFLFPREPTDVEKILFPGDYGGLTPEPDYVMAFPLVDQSDKIGPIVDRPPWGRREQAAISLLRSRIDAERNRAKDELRLRSQKTVKEAARAAGIGWIKAAVVFCAPAAPNQTELATKLAMAALDDGDDISEDMVGNAKTPQGWLNTPDRKSGRSRVSSAKIVKTRRG